MFITGLINSVFPAEQVSDKFRLRKMWLTEFGVQYPSTFEITFMQRDCDILDNYVNKVGTKVNVTYALKGKKFSKNGEEYVYNTIQGLGIQELKK